MDHSEQVIHLATVSRACRGHPEKPGLLTRLGDPLSTTAAVLGSGKDTIVNNTALDARVFTGVDAATGLRTPSLAAHPFFKPSGRVLRLLDVINTSEQALFSSRDVRNPGPAGHACDLMLRRLTGAERTGFAGGEVPSNVPLTGADG